MLIQKCVLRRDRLPLLPCDCFECDWYIHDPTYNNCFWVLAEILTERPVKFTFSEIACLEGTSETSIIEIYEKALYKIRNESGIFIQKDMVFDNIS